MKQHYLLLVLVIFFLGSCGIGSNNDNKNGQNKVPRVGAERPENCDDFLKEYEEWANVYVEVVMKFSRNPSNVDMAKKYNVVTRELISWTDDWKAFTTCSEDENYQKRYRITQDKIKKSQRKLEGE